MVLRADPHVGMTALCCGSICIYVRLQKGHHHNLLVVVPQDISMLMRSQNSPQQIKTQADSGGKYALNLMQVTLTKSRRE